MSVQETREYDQVMSQAQTTVHPATLGEKKPDTVSHLTVKTQLMLSNQIFLLQKD